MLRKKIVCTAAVIFIAAVLAYGNSLRNGFLIDDVHLIVKNDAIKDIANIFSVFSRAYIPGYYRPLAAASVMVDYFFWGLNPFGYHLTNVLLHGANAALVFFFLLTLLKKYDLSLSAGLLFAVHPLHTVAVNYIADRGNLLASACVLGGMVFYHHALKTRRMVWYAGGSILYVSGFFMRESMVLFPLYLACGAIAQTNKTVRKRIIILAAVLSGIAGIYILLRSIYMPLSLGGGGDWVQLFSREKIYAFCSAILSSLMLMVFPNRFLFFRRIHLPAASTQGIVIAVAVFLAVWCIRRCRKDKIFCFASCWFMAGVIPLYRLMMTFRRDVGIIMQENWLYLPSIGIFLAAGLVLERVKQARRHAYYMILGGVSLVFIVLSALHTLPWRSTETYCRYWLSYLPRNSIASWALAEHYEEIGDEERAIYWYKRAEQDCFLSGGEGGEIDSRLISIYNNLGCLHFDRNEHDLARHYFLEVIRLDKESDVAYSNLGNIEYLAGNSEAAIEYYRQQITHNFEHQGARKNLFLLYRDRGDVRRAMWHAVMFDFINGAAQPDISDSPDKMVNATLSNRLVRIAVSFIAEHEVDTAVRCLEDALRIDPGNVPARAQLDQIVGQERQSGD